MLVAPLIVREIEGTGGRDAVSPYGYPGLVGGEGSGGLLPDPLASLAPSVRTETPRPPLDPAGIDFTGTGLVSVFIRHRLGPSPLAGATERNVVQIADPGLPRKSRPSDRRQVRRNLEAGYALELVPGRETTPEQRTGFLDVYEQTMRRTGAAGHYFFGPAYFERILAAARTWLTIATGPDGDLAAASIAAVSDGYLHYYLSGSADSHLRAAPMKNVVTRLVEHAGELGLPLNLGGGIVPGDALEEFKRGFANRRQAWLTSELICDERAYAGLSAGRPRDGFFPAYRA
ncbi:MAG TPA: GNAT family N-acetyltransferase [Solirubrobacterales bacterium]|nr:GNAT family N-acetyltransferase [Solirubrobacterales bacterium]